MNGLTRHLRKSIRGIDRDGEWLWLVNTKVALKSIRNAIGPTCEMSWRKSSRPWWDKIVPKIPDDVFMFTFVRNPWDRMVSAFHYLQDDPGRFGVRWRQEGGVRLLRDFKAYVRDGLREDQNSIHFRPQLPTFMCNGGFIRKLFIGRFERLAEDWAIVAGNIGAKRELPHLNKTPHRHYTDYYDDETRQIVAEVYAEEIMALGYGFGE